MKTKNIHTWRATSIAIIAIIILQSPIINKQSSIVNAQCETGYFNPIGNSGDELSNITATDDDGNVYMAGYFVGTTLIGDIVLFSGSASTAKFIAKFDKKGDVLWAKAIASIIVNDIAVGKDGSLYVAALYNASTDITLPDGSGYSAVGESDVLTIKFTTDGDIAWAKSSGSTDYEFPKSIGVDASNNVYVAGIYQSQYYFANDTLSSNGNDHRKLFIIKYDKDGNEIMGIHTTGDASLYFSGTPIMKVDDNGNMFVTVRKFDGFANDTVHFGNNIYYAGEEIFVMKYDSTGEAVWAYSPEAVYDCSKSVLKYMTLDEYGDLYIVGYFNFPSNNAYVVFGNDTVRHKYEGSALVGDKFIAKIDNNENPLWAKKAGSRDMIIKGITVDVYQNTYLCGEFAYNAFFGNQERYLDPSIEMVPDAFFVKFDSSGSFSWVKQLTGINGGTSSANTISADVDGNIISCGDVQSTDEVIYDNKNELIISAKNSYNIFMIKFNEVGDMIPADFAGEDTIMKRCESAEIGHLNYSGYSYSWTPANNATTPNSYITTVTPDTSTYYVLAMSGSSCAYHDTVLVTVEQLENGIDFSASPRTSKVTPVLIAFTNETPSPNNFDFLWYFGDGETSVDINPIHTYGSGGSFDVVLTAISKTNSCRDSLTKSNYIVIDDTSSINEINKISFKAYPNPITDNLNIEAPFFIEKLMLINASGQTIKEEEINNTTAILVLSDYPSGTYYLQLFSEHGIANKSIIIY